MNEIYILLDNDFEGSEAIKGIFNNRNQAKLFLADYVLKSIDVISNNIELVEKEVEVSK